MASGRPLRALIVETAYLHNLDAERFEAGEQPVQRCLVGQRTLYYGLHRFHRGGQVLKVEQSLWREDSRNADLVTERWHPGPPVNRNMTVSALTMHCPRPLRAPHGG
jgi:hypothetical protein